MSQRMEFKPFHELFGTPPEQQQQQQQQQSLRPSATAFARRIVDHYG